MIYDIIIIGGGPGGYLAAERAGHAGLQVLLIEKRFIGGVCLNEGCIPSKALLYSAKMYDHARYSEKYGVVSESVSFDHGKVIKRKQKVVKTLVAGVKNALKTNKVTIVEDEAFIKQKTNEGFEITTKSNGSFIGKKLIIATGSMPFIPPIDGIQQAIDKNIILTNREILDIESVPENLIIIGGGVIGLEMASYFNSAGSKVTVIEMLDKIGGPIDKEISELLKKEYVKKGIEFKLNSKVVKINNNEVSYEFDGKTETVTGEKILMSVGRRPVTGNIGIENIGVEIEKGGIKVDNKMLTNIPNVYAIGDVTGYSMLAHTAYREAEVCINNITGKKDIMRYNAIPGVIYTNPEVATIGETEESAKQKGLNIEVKSISNRYSGRYLAENEGGSGICKIVINKDYNTVIGVHLIANYASEIIYGAGIMIEKEMIIDEIKEIVFPHPTVSEVIREGIFI